VLLFPTFGFGTETFKTNKKENIQVLFMRLDIMIPPIFKIFENKITMFRLYEKKLKIMGSKIKL
jgi:hypothetical protein